jgi:hypothetical protein
VGADIVSALHATSPLTVAVPCRGETHHLRYEEGRLLAPDHADVEGEMTLMALGGESTPCAELVTAWCSAAADLRVLTLTERSAADRLQRPPPEVLFTSFSPQGMGIAHPFGRQALMPHLAGLGAVPVGRGWGRTRRAVPAVGFVAPMAGATPAKVDPLLKLLALSSALAQRLVFEVVTTWSARIARGDAPAASLPALGAALAGRAKAALSEWAGLPFDEIRVDMIDPGTTPTIDMADGLSVTLPFAWLGDVWLPRLAQLFGRFTLAATENAGTITLDTVDTAGQRRDITMNLDPRSRPRA